MVLRHALVLLSLLVLVHQSTQQDCNMNIEFYNANGGKVRTDLRVPALGISKQIILESSGQTETVSVVGKGCASQPWTYDFYQWKDNKWSLQKTMTNTQSSTCGNSWQRIPNPNNGLPYLSASCVLTQNGRTTFDAGK